MLPMSTTHVPRTKVKPHRRTVDFGVGPGCWAEEKKDGCMLEPKLCSSQSL